MTAASLSSWIALALVLAIAPLLPGLATRVTAAITGRRGAPWLQPYRDLVRLIRKGAVFSHTTTWMFGLAPVAVPAAGLLAATLLPLDGRRALMSFPGDPIAFASLLAFGRIVFALAALDTGSSFEGMGASRVLTVATFAEPAWFSGLVALALATHGLSLEALLGAPLAAAWRTAAAPLAMVAVTWFVVLLAEASRGPVDNPATHLELTMIHEAASLDHSGPDLALLLYGAALNFALLAALVVGVLMPRASLAAGLALPLLAAGLLAVAATVGVIEGAMARLRLAAVPQLLVAAAALSALGVVLLLR